MGTTFGLTCGWEPICFYALSQMLDTKVKFQRLAVVSFKQMYWTGTQ